jgi:hypothetical protein
MGHHSVVKELLEAGAEVDATREVCHKCCNLQMCGKLLEFLYYCWLFSYSYKCFNFRMAQPLFLKHATKVIQKSLQSF